jgi:hypothetical protein
MQKFDLRFWCLSICHGVLIKVLAGIILAYCIAPEVPVSPPCTASGLIEVAAQMSCI